MYKLNTDGALDLRRGRRGFGAVIRNDKGEFMGASAQCVLGSFSILATELMAVKAGLCFAIDMGLSQPWLRLTVQKLLAWLIALISVGQRRAFWLRSSRIS